MAKPRDISADGSQDPAKAEDLIRAYLAGARCAVKFRDREQVRRHLAEHGFAPYLATVSTSRFRFERWERAGAVYFVTANADDVPQLFEVSGTHFVRRV